MQSDENSGEEGDARANLGGDQKVIGFVTEWVSAYNFIKGMVLFKQTLFHKTSIRNCCMECASLLLSPSLSFLLAFEKRMSTWILLSMLLFLLQWHGANMTGSEVTFSHYRFCFFILNDSN